MTPQQRADGLHAHLSAGRGRRIAQTQLWSAFDRVDPASRGSVERRALLRETLALLADQQRVVLPSARSWDRFSPTLPRFVTLPAAAPPPRRTVQDTTWMPQMSWVVTARLSGPQLSVCEAVNSWLRRDPSSPVLPLRERAWQVLGDEKSFDPLLRTDLFGPGRLDLTLLRARLTPPPLLVQRLAGPPVLLVVENSATYASMLQLLDEPDAIVGGVAFGAGRSFETSVASVPVMAPWAQQLLYFGDADLDGLLIPQQAAAALPAGLTLTPALSLYRLLARCAEQDQRRVPPVTSATAAEAVRWLSAADSDLSRWAHSCLLEGRLARQEAIGLPLRMSGQWRTDLATQVGAQLPAAGPPRAGVERVATDTDRPR